MANQLVPSSSFSTTPSWTYDVFLSFRGEDTRYNFTDHLYRALDRHGINTFIDHRELPIGEEISPTLLEAIENSRISVIIFSENYASSRWCLDELVHILECRKSKGQMTRPIFYKVEPSDVRHQKNSYGAAFADHSRKYENDPEKVQRWRTALTEAANLKGATLNEGQYETKFINDIVEEISTKVLNRTYLHVAYCPVGIESCAKEVEALLDVGGNDHRVVGIWGTSGIGKTTIAKDVYNAIARKFEGSCFLTDVSETSASREGLIQLQKTFLSKILRGTKLEIVDVHEGISLIKKLLRQKKILLILDDVDKLERLKDWVDVDCFGEGSRVIITTKDRRLLNFFGGQWIYEVQKLEYDKALELFSWNAFKRNRPPDDYLSLAQRAIVYAQGLPLALDIIGSYLRNKSIGRWQAVLNNYDSYIGEPYTDIQITLRKTYDAWDDDLKQVFLDIVCFFKGENRDYVLQMLRSSTLKVREDIIDVLVEKAIIAIEDNRILMHDLLEKMGKHIVYEESPTEPGKRSRLWCHEDVCDVLINCRGTEKIRGIVVKLPEPYEIPLNPESFLKMVNLEFFINRNAHFSGQIDYLPNSLRLIEFSGRLNIDQKHTYVLNLPSNLYPRQLVKFDVSSNGIRQLNIDQKHTYVLNLPSNFHPRQLVKFDVSSNGIRQLKELKNMTNLTWMNLNDCEFLEKIPELSGSPNLEHLFLSGCKNLVEVDDSVGFLDKLVTLDLSGCSELTRFATRLGLRSLIELNLWGCTRLERFPEIEKDKMKSLTRLLIGKSGIRELPSSIAYLTGLTELIANGCKLQNVPDLSGSLNIKLLGLSDCKSLIEVHDSVGFLDKLVRMFKGCRSLESFPEIEGKMESLDYLDIEESGIRELPSIAYFTRLRHLKAGGCKLQNIQLLPYGKKVKFDEVSSELSLDLSRCNLSESDFLVPLDCWSALTTLYLIGNNFVSLPDCISKAVNLDQLFLGGCKKLREIPVLPPKLRELNLEGCTSLEKIPKQPPRLERLFLCHCVGLSSDEVAKLENNLLNEETDPRSRFPPKLKELDLEGCISLEKIPKLPPTLEELDLSNCSGLSGDEVAKLENNLLNEEIDPRSRFELNIIYPGNEIPKWFSYTSNYPTTSQHLPEYEDDESDREFRFEIPLKLQVGETLLGLALSFVYEPPTCNKWRKAPIQCIIINGERRFEHSLKYSAYIKATHVSLALRALGGLREQEQLGDICEVVFRFHNGCPVKSCGVHCLLRNQDSGSSPSEDEEDEEQEQEQEQPSDSDVPFDMVEDEEQLHLPLRPTSSLGKRPCPRGSSDIVDDAYDQQQ